jgi:hypothetical protein
LVGLLGSYAKKADFVFKLIDASKLTNLETAVMIFLLSVFNMYHNSNNKDSRDNHAAIFCEV